VSKLFALKEWLSLADAASRLSTSFGEPVTEADLIQLALEGRLRLSLQILHTVYARRMYKKLESEIEFQEIEYTLPIQYDPEQTVRTRREPVDGEVMCLPGLCDDRELFQLGMSPIGFTRTYPDRHVVDLPLTIFSRSYLLQCFDYFRGDTEGEGECGTDKLVIQEKNGDLWHIESYNDFLPGDVAIVVRTQTLRALEQSFEPEPKIDQEKALSSRERDTLLKLIAAMAKEGYKHDPTNKTKSAVSDILADAQRAGLSVSDQTIRDKLKEAWELLPGNPPQS
jgi:hypothetical protein